MELLERHFLHIYVCGCTTFNTISIERKRGEHSCIVGSLHVIAAVCGVVREGAKIIFSLLHSHLTTIEAQKR
jgi:hypothetical protein